MRIAVCPDPGIRREIRRDGASPHHGASRVLARLLVVPVLVAGIACTEPELVDEQPTTDADLPDIAEAPPTDDRALREQVDALDATFGRLDEALAAVERAGDLESARAAGAEALAALIGEDPDAVAAPAEPTGQVPGPAADPPLFPSRTPDRAVTAEDATLVAAVTAARDAGGALGRELIAMLSDAVAGDLGGWQRDPEGMIGVARDAGDPTAEITDLEAAILELPGEGTRALAWVFVVVDAPDVDVAAQGAERARAHVGLMAAALGELTGADASASA